MNIAYLSLCLEIEGIPVGPVYIELSQFLFGFDFSAPGKEVLLGLSHE